MGRFILILVLVPLTALTAGAAVSGSDLPTNDVFDPAGKLSPLAALAVYHASSFPLAVQFTTPDATWNGAQWKANLWSPQEIARRHLKCPRVCQPPYYGWVAVGKGGRTSTGPPTALILIMTGYTRTPSVPATLRALQRGSGATYEPTTTVKLAGLTVTQLDGQTTGANHFFIPFSPASHGAAGGNAADRIEMDGPGHPFRATVLNVRGKTVVVFIGSLVLTADQFQSFLSDADALLNTLTFPA
jgi:hypothetical protein